MSQTIAAPATEPCRHCPYRRDVPSGIWAPEEYAKLASYDADTPNQPTGVFVCHLRGSGDKSCACGGWAGCHDGDNLLALRLAVAAGVITPGTAEQIRDYTSPVPLFTTGAEAAAHGLADIDDPGPKAVAAMDRIARSRQHLGEPVHSRNGLEYPGLPERTPLR